MEPQGDLRKTILGRGHKTPKQEHAYAQPTEETMTGLDNIIDQRLTGVEERGMVNII